MEQNVFVLLLGIVLGAAVTSGIWAVLWALIKGDNRLQADRVAIMQEIAALCVEIDSLIDGAPALAAGSPALAALMEKLLRKFTVSMPLLDVYYVKYIESMIARYKQTPVVFSGKAASATAAAPIKTPAPAHLEIVKEKPAVQPPPAAKAPVEKPAPAKPLTKEPAQRPPASPPQPVVQKAASEIPSDKTAEFIVQSGAWPDPSKTQMIHEKMDADLTEAITTQMPLKPGEELKKAQSPVTSPKAPAQDVSREETGEVNIEDLLVTQKFEVKTDASAAAKPGAPDEHFISGEDVIDKLDSFFGFENK